MDYTVHGILQARILEWVAFPFSRGSSQPRDQTNVSCIAGGFLTSWVTTGVGSLSLLQWIFTTQEFNWVSCIAGRFFTNWAMRKAHYGRKWRTKEPLNEGERGDWKSWFKIQHSKNGDHGIRSHHFMQIDGETIERVTDFIFWAPKSLQMVTAAMKWKDACYLEEKLWPRQHIKSRDITLLTKVHLIKAMVFPVVMCGCESRTIKKAERWRIDAFELWC